MKQRETTQKKTRIPTLLLCAACLLTLLTACGGKDDARSTGDGKSSGATVSTSGTKTPTSVKAPDYYDSTDGSAEFTKELLDCDVSAADESGQCGANLNWYWFKEKKLLVIRGSGDMYDYTDEHDTNPAPWVGLKTGDHTNAVKYCVVESGVTSLGDYAFDGQAQYARGIRLPNTLKRIGESCFDHLRNIKIFTIPASVTELGVRMFFDAGVTSVVFADGCAVEAIPELCFAGCGDLTDLTLPDTVKALGADCFSRTKSLKSFHLPPLVTTIPSGAFNSAGVEVLDLTGITTIEKEAFIYVQSREVRIPGTVKTIAEGAFLACPNLEKVVLGEGVETIERNAFYKCEILVLPELPSSICTIGENAFYDCYGRFEVFTVPEGVVSIGENAFYRTGMVEAVLPDSLESIPDSALDHCPKLEKVTLSAHTWILDEKGSEIEKFSYVKETVRR